LNIGLSQLNPCKAPQHLSHVGKMYIVADGVYSQVPDLNPPTSPSIIKKDTSSYDNQAYVTFNTYADDADSMIISEYKNFNGASWQAYQQQADYDIKQGNGEISIYIKFKDISGNESLVDSTMFEYDSSPPGINRKFKATCEQREPVAYGQDYQILGPYGNEVSIIEDQYDSKTFEVYYRHIGEIFNNVNKEEMRISYNPPFSFVHIEIPGTLFNEYSIDFRFIVTDSAGNSYKMEVDNLDYFSQPVNLFGRELGTSQLMPGGTGSAGFSLVSLPMKPGNEPFYASMLGRFGQYGEMGDWMFWKYEGHGNWRSSSTVTIDEGKSYFLQLRNNRRLSPAGGGTTAMTTDGVEGKISGWYLRPGDWTLIANPYMMDIQLNQLKLKHRDILLSEASPYFQVWTYSGGSENNGWTNQDISLEVWGGLAIYLDSLAGADTIVFANPQEPWEIPIGKSSTAYSDQLAKLAENDWLIQIKAQGNDFSDHQNYFGCRKDAKMDQDVYDWYEPPTLPGGISLSFSHPEWKNGTSFASDIRPLTDEGYTWNVNINGEGGTSVSLDFENIQSVPPRFKVILLDEQTGLLRDLQKQSTLSVRIPKETSTKNLKIIAGTEVYIQDQTSNIQTIPDNFTLEPNYPNPFNPTTVIRYGLPIAGRVTLKVFDLLGQEVLKLEEDNYRESGYYEHVIDMRDYGSGVYFYRIDVSGVENFNAVNKMILVK
jgi:hypothetical protein